MKHFTPGRIVFGLAFIVAGVLHFVNTEFYLRMMPSVLPEPKLLVWLSGVAESALGIGLLVPKTARWAAFGLIALLIAVFPANINMALHPEQWPDLKPLALWVRLPFQLVFIGIAAWFARRPKP